MEKGYLGKCIWLHLRAAPSQTRQSFFKNVPCKRHTTTSLAIVTMYLRIATGAAAATMRPSTGHRHAPGGTWGAPASHASDNRTFTYPSLRAGTQSLTTDWLVILSLLPGFTFQEPNRVIE